MVKKHIITGIVVISSLVSGTIQGKLIRMTEAVRCEQPRQIIGQNEPKTTDSDSANNLSTPEVPTGSTGKININSDVQSQDESGVRGLPTGITQEELIEQIGSLNDSDFNAMLQELEQELGADQTTFNEVKNSLIEMRNALKNPTNAKQPEQVTHHTPTRKKPLGMHDPFVAKIKSLNDTEFNAVLAEAENQPNAQETKKLLLNIRNSANLQDTKQQDTAEKTTSELLYAIATQDAPKALGKGFSDALLAAGLGSLGKYATNGSIDSESFITQGLSSALVDKAIDGENLLHKASENIINGGIATAGNKLNATMQSSLPNIHWSIDWAPKLVCMGITEVAKLMSSTIASTGITTVFGNKQTNNQANNTDTIKDIAKSVIRWGSSAACKALLHMAMEKINSTSTSGTQGARN